MWFEEACTYRLPIKTVGQASLPLVVLDSRCPQNRLVRGVDLRSSSTTTYCYCF